MLTAVTNCGKNAASTGAISRTGSCWMNGPGSGCPEGWGLFSGGAGAHPLHPTGAVKAAPIQRSGGTAPKPSEYLGFRSPRRVLALGSRCFADHWTLS